MVKIFTLFMCLVFIISGCKMGRCITKAIEGTVHGTSEIILSPLEFFK